AVESYQNGVPSVMTMSKSFGPPSGPEYALDRDRLPLKTTVSSLPTFWAKVLLSLLGEAWVVERLIWTLLSVSEKAAPDTPSGRRAICVIQPAPPENSVAAITC